jgi:hypothetical protein
MYIEIFKYIDRIFAMIRPRKLLYMAIDGVAPRAKMNQQRSRRFRAAQEMKEKEEKKRMLRDEFGIQLDDEEGDSSSFDSNCITPGTPFMQKLAENLKFYIAKRLNSDPGWKNVGLPKRKCIKLTFGMFRSKLFYQMHLYLQRENTRSWIILEGKEVILIMIRTPHMSFMDLMQILSCWDWPLMNRISKFSGRMFFIMNSSRSKPVSFATKWVTLRKTVEVRV